MLMVNNVEVSIKNIDILNKLSFKEFLRIVKNIELRRYFNF